MPRPIAWLLGVAFALFVVSVSVLTLTAPSFTHFVASKTSHDVESGLPMSRMLEIAEQVRVYVVDPDAEPLPAVVDGRPGFDGPAVWHLRDVRVAFLKVRVLTAVLAVILAIAIGIEGARKRTRLLGEALVAGAVVSVVLVVLGVLAATLNFDVFFSAFHGLLFKEGTWTFSEESLLIETFPESFWMAAGITWGVLVALGASVMWLVGRSLKGRDEALA